MFPMILFQRNHFKCVYQVYSERLIMFLLLSISLPPKITIYMATTLILQKYQFP